MNLLNFFKPMEILGFLIGLVLGALISMQPLLEPNRQECVAVPEQQPEVAEE